MLVWFHIFAKSVGKRIAKVGQYPATMNNCTVYTVSEKTAQKQLLIW